MTSTRHAVVDTADLGEVTLVADGDAVTGLYFRHHWYRPADEALGELVPLGDDALLTRAAGELAEYLAGRRREFEVPTATAGDPFQERVWALLRAIPYGRTTTYGDLAGELGDRTLAQQVGQAVGRNPVCVLVPCHRVVGADGRLTGYAGGLRRKRALLELEDPDRLF